ncbi:MAG: hypothetical protein NUW37_03375 [Planctomycetes bacterium]|nr:hypothetical protein [Planctomycetota bacterium]
MNQSDSALSEAERPENDRLQRRLLAGVRSILFKGEELLHLANGVAKGTYPALRSACLVAFVIGALGVTFFLTLYPRDLVLFVSAGLIFVGVLLFVAGRSNGDPRAVVYARTNMRTFVADYLDDGRILAVKEFADDGVRLSYPDAAESAPESRRVLDIKVRTERRFTP